LIKDRSVEGIDTNQSFVEDPYSEPTKSEIIQL